MHKEDSIRLNQPHHHLSVLEYRLRWLLWIVVQLHVELMYFAHARSFWLAMNSSGYNLCVWSATIWYHPDNDSIARQVSAYWQRNRRFVRKVHEVFRYDRCLVLSRFLGCGSGFRANRNTASHPAR